MRRRLVIVVAFACLIGLGASFLVYQAVSRVAGGPSARPSTEQVVVAAVNMSLADTVTERHVKLVDWPLASVPPGAVKTLASAEGRVVRASIVAGEPLLEDKLAPELSGRGGIMPMLVPEGRRGVTIRVDEATRESGFVLPNSRVDVVVTMTREQNDRISKVILQDVVVLAAGQSVEIRDNKPVKVTTVTLALTPEESERLALAQTHGKLVLATRNLRDTRIVSTSGMTPDTLLGASTRPAVGRGPAVRPDVRPAASPRMLKPPAFDSYSVSVIRGTKLTEHRFVKDGEQWLEVPTK